MRSIEHKVEVESSEMEELKLVVVDIMVSSYYFLFVHLMAK